MKYLNPLYWASPRALTTVILSTILPIASTVSASTLLDNIKERGEISVGTEAAYEPYEFTQNGKIVGYSKQILDYVVAGLDVELNQLDLPWAGILPGVLAKKFDFVATSVTINEKRAKKYAFTRPIGVNETIVLIRANDNSINDVTDLSGKVVATQLGSSLQPVAESIEDKLKKSSGGGYKDLKLYQAFPETFIALGAGQVDAVLFGSVQAAIIMKKRPGVFKIAAHVGNPRYLAWVTRPDNLELRDYINKKIDELEKSGQLNQWQQEWFGYTMKLPTSNYLPNGAF